jgi:hypothetical protein
MQCAVKAHLNIHPVGHEALLRSPSGYLLVLASMYHTNKWVLQACLILDPHHFSSYWKV